MGTTAGVFRAGRLTRIAAAAALLSVGLSGTASPPMPGASGVALPRPAAAAKPTGCLIEPDRWADVGSPVVGIVEQVGADRGDRVARGQMLVQLRSSIEQATQGVAETRAGTDAEVRGAEVALDLAEQKHRRAQTLETEKFISPQALEQTGSEVRLARSRLDQARAQQRIWSEETRVTQAQLGQRTVRSPFEGIVVDRFANTGERVEERPLMRVAVIDPLRVELMVPVAQWGRLKVGDSLTVLPELPGAAAVVARVSQVDRLLDAASNTFRVRLKLPNPGHTLPAGLRCKVDLDTLVPAPARAEPSPATARAKQGKPAVAARRDKPAVAAKSAPATPAVPKTVAQR